MVKPSTILALLLWEVGGNGGYPIINFTAQYRLAYTNDSWLPISPNHITPNCVSLQNLEVSPSHSLNCKLHFQRQIEVYKLLPNTTYQFRIWATNLLGRGEITEAFGTTKDNYNEMGKN